MDDMEKSNAAITHMSVHARSGKGAVVLVPHPSDSPLDPLNWSRFRKYRTLFVVCFAVFAASCTPTAFQLAYFQLAATYHEEPELLSQTISIAVAGIVVGSILLNPLARILGNTSIIFWSLAGCIATQAWAATDTSQDGIGSFIGSRVLAGLFSSMPVVIGPNYIMDVFFLHERGVALTCYELSLLLGFYAGPTIGGFIVQTDTWPAAFWWTMAPLGIAFILVGLDLPETRFARGSNTKVYPNLPQSFFKNRFVTLVWGQATTAKVTGAELGRLTIAPLIIALCPAIFVVGFYTFISFGFAIGVNILLTIFLQTPVAKGGYGFSPFQNACFTFTSWMALLVGQIAGVLLGDRLPLRMSRKFGRGVWTPEYRLANIIIPAILLPVGLGIFGAGLQYHLHYMVLALGFFLIQYSAFLSVPVCVNYAVECFTDWSQEASITMSTYRLLFSVVLPFFTTPWEAAVGPGWLFGTAAFLCVFAGLLFLPLAWKGHTLRGMMLMKGYASTEEGEQIIDDERG